MGKPIKILQIVPSISLVYGGPSQMVRGLSAGLARQGSEVTVITTDSNGDIDQAPLAVPLAEPVAEDGYQVIYFRCSPFRRYKFSLGLLGWLWQNAHRYDIAHIHALFSPVSSLSATVARQRGLPYVLRPLGTLDPADLQKKRQLKKIYVSLLERPNIQGAAAMHFTAAQEAAISERFGVKTRDWVIPLGVTSTPSTVPQEIAQAAVRDRFQIPAEVPILLFMSRVDPKKGLDLLLPALEQLHQAGVKFHFILSGANPQDRQYEESIATQIQASPLADCTTITGFVTGDEKAQILQAADLFVLPSYYENFGIAIAEAMMVGKAVVISDQIHIWQAIQDSGSGWVVPCEIPALAAALQTALLDPQERQLRGQNAQAHAQANFGWDAISAQTLQAYEEILQA